MGLCTQRGMGKPEQLADYVLQTRRKERAVRSSWEEEEKTGMSGKKADWELGCVSGCIWDMTNVAL